MSRKRKLSQILKDFEKYGFKKRLLATLIFLGLFSFYNLLFLNKVFPNIYLANYKVAGKNKEAVGSLVKMQTDLYKETPIAFELEGQTIMIKPEELGVEFDVVTTVDEAFKLGRSGSLGHDLILRIKAPFGKTKIAPVYKIDFGRLTEVIDKYFSFYEKRAADATVEMVGAKAQIREADVGKVVDRTRLILTFRDLINNLESSPIKVVTIEEKPAIETDGAQKALSKTQLLAKGRIVLAFETDKWTLSGKSLFELLRFDRQGYEGGYLVKAGFGKKALLVKSLKYAESPVPNLNVSLDSQKLDEFVQEIAQSLDRPTIDATLKFEGGRVVKFTPAQDGRTLDKNLTKRLILAKVSVDDPSSEEAVITNLPVSVVKAKIENEEVNSLGIQELVGRGVSYFAGSIANRVYNIALGASRVNGTIVTPGETFSFNRAVGEVSAGTGYKQAYVISQGRTILDDGGGICQVSTTIFRAALASGLPIIARTAHAYRVAYYEQAGFKPGFDATVWAPTVDFQFKNDTGHYLLIQAVVDRANSKLEVDIYGTADGRRVEISEPVISNKIPPPPDKHQDDPTLPRGTVKQVDFAAQGATVVFSREVYRGSELLIDESFKSNYRPWQAVYLVGTGG